MSCDGGEPNRVIRRLSHDLVPTYGVFCKRVTSAVRDRFVLEITVSPRKRPPFTGKAILLSSVGVGVRMSRV